MSLNDVVSAERVHIGFFGCRNAGKSSIVNAVTGQSLSLVSDVKGTTTDPVKKAMELLPLGPVVIIDTPGIDDEGTLGELRVSRAREVLRYTDVAVLVVDGVGNLQKEDRELIALFRERQLPYIIVYNKIDLLGVDGVQEAPGTQKVPGTQEAPGTQKVSGIQETPGTQKASGIQEALKVTGTPANLYQEAEKEDEHVICVSARTGMGIWQLKEKIAHAAGNKDSEKRLVADLLAPNDLVVLVVPIDSAAPKGRLILPQQQTIRDVLDAGATAVVCREKELAATLGSLGKKPKMVITDSQAFGYVSKVVPEDVPLTSFSILMVRYKGDLEGAAFGAAQLDRLRDGDKVLISEGCTHHRQCDDIGTVKMPAWIRNYTGKDIAFEFTSGGQFPEDLSGYKLVVHCGGCMLNEKEMQYRTRYAAEMGVAMTNYGIAIAKMHGILERSLELFPAARKALSK